MSAPEPRFEGGKEKTQIVLDVVIYISYLNQLKYSSIFA